MRCVASSKLSCENRMRLFHVSDNPEIEIFNPRQVPSQPDSRLQGKVVWAVDEEHLPHYLLPRDCPRVCFARNDTSSAQDVARYLADPPQSRVIAVEWDWLENIRAAELSVYEFPVETFKLIDTCAGYFISQDSVVPLSVHHVSDAMAELRGYGVELRFMHDLWRLHDNVASSSLDFSMIRMRNAKKR